ncbi:protein of unknown function DUF218 [Methanolacinia petrolearia DSM 11571]|uniref:DUF218 domain-containing protein n=1 Tax=Methanolacinia petrolearia (strain DSM 11571 / OCM 486 / SEBR 4847) TaxID=679926 RepID=E1RJM0_METP4|nr:YdcF family protein [Methanolacinia petrolearia]ADN35667.1 protein of unknown function DUF218 [Methanolacinia petrolearia DSM 11571]
MMPKDETTVIIILGNRLQSKQIHQELKGRMDCGLKVFREEGGILLLSGGRSNPEIDVPECGIMKDYAVGRGVDPSNIITEDSSLDTIGNAVFSREIVDKLDAVSKIFVITSCYHVERSRYLFDMCFGDRYLLDFEPCYECPGDPGHEEESMEEAIRFFRGIERGDIEKIMEGLYLQHDLYKF